MGTAVFGAPEFKARSGQIVRTLGNGDVAFDHSNGYLAASVVFDAEEFFLAKRDADLGRWRYPLDLDFVVHAEGDRIAVVNERDGFIVNYTRGDDVVLESLRQIAAHKVRVAYFEAHPERKPWQDAKAGEVWAVRIDDMDELVPVTRVESGHFDIIGGFGYIRPHDVVEGHCIWPEPVDAEIVEDES